MPNGVGRVDARTMQAQHALMLRAIASRLEGRFNGLFTRDTLQHYVEDSYEQLSKTATVYDHIPAFVERFAIQRLDALAKSSGLVNGPPVEVLFVCERNDGLSQMAASLFDAIASGRAHAHSADTTPAGALLDEAVHALHEIDVEVVDAFPKPISAEIERVADLIVTLDAHDDIPIVDGKRYRAWRLADHHGEGLAGYRLMRNELRERIGFLVAEVAPQSPTDDPQQHEPHTANR
jgi:arsenate reductase (thioredoxin)